MAITVDMTNCPCCVCCGDRYGANLHGLHVLTVFDWNDGHYEPSFNAFWNADEGKWTGTGDCNGQVFELKFWCNPGTNSWLFDLLSGGSNYANPAVPGTPGGATLLGCNSFFLYAQITAGYYADDFPFCDKGGSFPSGQFLNSFQLFVFE